MIDCVLDLLDALKLARTMIPSLLALLRCTEFLKYDSVALPFRYRETIEGRVVMTCNL